MGIRGVRPVGRRPGRRDTRPIGAGRASRTADRVGAGVGIRLPPIHGELLAQRKVLREQVSPGHPCRADRGDHETEVELHDRILPIRKDRGSAPLTGPDDVLHPHGRRCWRMSVTYSVPRGSAVAHHRTYDVIPVGRAILPARLARPGRGRIGRKVVRRGEGSPAALGFHGVAGPLPAARVSSEKFIEAHSGKIGDISIYGQESNYTTWRLAKMNLAIRGIDGQIAHGGQLPQRPAPRPARRPRTRPDRGGTSGQLRPGSRRARARAPASRRSGRR